MRAERVRYAAQNGNAAVDGALHFPANQLRGLWCVPAAPHFCAQDYTGHEDGPEPIVALRVRLSQRAYLSFAFPLP